MTQLTLVTGNNNGICISEYKSDTFNELRPSLCSIQLYATAESLFYSIIYEDKVHYLKELNWQENPLEVLSKEFDKEVEFASVKATFFGMGLKVLPKSFHGTNTPSESLLQTSSSSLPLTYTPVSSYVAAYHVDSHLKKAITTTFPSCEILPVISSYCHSKTNADKSELKLFQQGDQTILLLFNIGKLVLAEQYLTPTVTESLYFALSALQINHLENTSDCVLHLIGCEKHSEWKETFQSYFEFTESPETIGLANSIMLSNKEKQHFQFVLGK